MTVQEFIDGYKLSQKKDEFVKKHIINQYVSYFLKQAEAQKIVDLSTFKDVNGKQVFWLNSPVRYQLFITRLITNYTDIDLDTDFTTGFDELNKNGLINAIISAIPESEYKEFSTLVQMCLDDTLENQRSFAGYIDTKLEALNLMLDALSNDDQIKNVISEVASKINQEG